MRIVAGEWRGRRLVAPPGRSTRPTADRVREALFAVLQSLLLSGRWQPQLGRLPDVPAAEGPVFAQAGEAPGEPAGRALDEPGGESAGLQGGEPRGVIAGPLAGLTVIDLYAGSGAVGLEALSRGAATCTFVEAARPAVAALRRNLAALGVPDDRVRLLAKHADAALREEVAASRRYTLLFADPPYTAYAEQEGLLATSVPELLSPDGLAVVETARRVEPDLPLTPLASKLYGDTRVTFMALPG